MCGLPINNMYTEEVYRSIIEDPHFKQIIDRKKEILSKAIYNYILNTETREMEIKFSEPIQKILDELDKLFEDGIRGLEEGMTKNIKSAGRQSPLPPKPTV